MGKDGKGLTRRQLFTFWRRETDGEPASPAPAWPPPLRPPSALEEPLLLTTCIRCGHCVDACPADAIYPLGAEWGAAAGTPAVDARRQPCVLCAGLQCTHVCPSGALSPLWADREVAMGSAIVDETRCVLHHGQACDACHRACPIPGALVIEAGRVRVAAELCVGCGLCEHVCPTDPASIRVAPRAAV